MTLNQAIARALVHLERGDESSASQDQAVDAVVADFRRMKPGEGRDITLATIRNITEKAGLSLDGDHLAALAAELVVRRLVRPIPQVIDGDHYIMSQGEDFDSLIDLLSGREPVIGPHSGMEMHPSQVFLSFEVIPEAIPEAMTARHGLQIGDGWLARTLNGKWFRALALAGILALAFGVQFLVSIALIR